MKEFWDKRYLAEEYAFGKEPNKFFKQSLNEYNVAGRILFAAEGEGRNAVYAAEQGLEAHAFDISKEGKNKAIQLASEKGVSIQYQVGEITNLNYDKESFDAAVFVFAHFPPALRANIHKTISELVKPGGLIILEGFSVGNLPYREKNPGIGGPDNEAMLFTSDIIQKDFSDFESLLIKKEIIELNEGAFHQGTGEVMRFIGKKKS
jgi:ubiquinone/menaquinone biosynthesis C-methylase UbiE